MKVIIWHDANGISIEYPNTKYRQRGESEDAFLVRMVRVIQEKDPRKAQMAYEITDSTALPTDRSTRNAWRWDTTNKLIRSTR
jgi:hypothetical protein